jgi:hypothetical protein
MVTLIYADRYAWLRGLLRMVTRIVTHGQYAWLPRLLPSDARGRNQMVTQGCAWLRMGQFADVSTGMTGLLWKPVAKFFQRIWSMLDHWTKLDHWT